MIHIDGSSGEGGGQILRSSLSLSLATGQPFKVDHIRAGRERPGLLRQHLTAVLAAAEVGSATVDGAALGSTSLSFTPGGVRSGDYRFKVGTAGSTTLVLQTILPALVTAAGPSTVTIEGGTHNKMAPPFEFLRDTFLPLLERMGPRIEMQLERYGFYPAGGGRLVIHIQPVARLTPIELGERGGITSRQCVALVANLPRHIGQRELEKVSQMLNWNGDSGVIEETRNSTSPGNAVMVKLTSAEVTEVFTAFGELGVSAEKVADSAARQARGYLVSQAAAGEYLTDQLLLPMALCGSGSFTGHKLSLHARTNMAVIGQFLPIRFEVTEAVRHLRVDVRA